MSETRICPHCREETAERTCPHDGFQTVDAAQYAEPDPGALVGTVFEDRYRIEEMIGEGGMGAVYRATQLAVSRQVALKLLHKELATKLTMVARFQQEARAVAALSHPHIIGLIDFGQAADGSLYLVMEFLEGEPLSERMCREERMSIPQTTDIALQVLEALVEAHAHGVVHRDLKPENLFLTRRGRKDDFVKVLDFGIAKVSGDLSTKLTLTGTGIAIGTPAYLSPEQARASEVTPQSDLYSLAAILYEMLTGSRLFKAKSATDFLMAHVKEQPEHPTVDGVRIEGPLVDFIMACLAKDPDARPAGAMAGIEWLDDGLESGSTPISSDAQRPSPVGATAPVALSTGTQEPVGDTEELSHTDKGRPWLRIGLVAVGVVAGVLIANLVPDKTEDQTAVTPSSEPATKAPPITEESANAEATKPVSPDPETPPKAVNQGNSEAAEDVPSTSRKVKITSEPGGAKIRRGDQVLGVTPLEVQWAEEEDPPTLDLELDGRRKRVTLTVEQDGKTLLIPLPEAEAAPSKPPKKKSKKPRKKTKKKSKKPSGDDEFKMLD
ncbi:MAG: serine/threonine-protein kinase [Myxococcota bacterium]|nr:serine/threonine-protein kinase [Myxococcota bacterium]